MDPSTTSIVSALGGGSGIDMAKLARDLAQARFAAQVNNLQSGSELMETRVSAASSLKNQLSQLAAALGDRIRTGDLAPAAAVARPGIATVSAAPGRIPRGTFSLEVTQLASAQTLIGKPFATAGALVGEGTLALQFGTVAGSSFTADAARGPIEIAVSAEDTLSSLAGKLNALGAGLTAYVANGPGGAQLVVKGEDGAANGFKLAGSGPSASGGVPAAGNIDYLNWDPASDAGQLQRTALDAAFRLDGIAMTSSSNRVADAAAGLSLDLSGVNPGAPTTISFTSQDEAIKSVVRDLVSALNEIAGTLKNSADPLAGELGNDAGARSLKRSLAELAGAVVMPSAAAGEPRTFGDLGVTLIRDGTFQLDEARLGLALRQHSAATGAMFTTGLNGVYGSLEKLARNIGNTSDPGSLGGSIARYSKAKADIAERMADLAEKQEALRTQLTRSFTWADSNIASSQSTLNFLKNQIAIWNAPRN